MLTVKHITLLLLSLCLVAFCAQSTADDHNINSNQNHFLLQKVAQAPQVTNKDSHWLQLFEQPGNSQHYYLANKQGQIYQLEQDNPKSTALLLDLPQLMPKKSVLSLNAFTLHPNFSKLDQAGYATFYTAHVENHLKDSKVKRLHEPDISMTLSYDAVVTEWQLTADKQVNLSQKREVLRVAIPSAENGIKQLSFNPYSKSWHEDFSQLYISLSQSQALKQYPLYSGVILRIHPQKSASHSYTVSHSNPYYANEKIEKAIYLLGAGKIQQFIWPQKHSTRLLISHLYDSNNTWRQLLSYNDAGDDWREQAPKEYIYQSEAALSANSLLVYRGQNAPALRNKLLLLTQNKQHWQLHSLSDELTSSETAPDKNSANQQPDGVTLTKIEWQLKQPALLARQLSLYRDNRGELLFFNKDTGAIYQLFQQEGQGLPENKPSVLGGITFFFIIMLGLLSGYIFYQINISKNSAKALVRREFSNLSLTKDELSLKLFRRHQHEAEKIIALADIHQCQLLLGDLAIATINTTLGHGFNNQQEQKLREIFHIEQIDKMIDGKVRRISLVINTTDKTNHTICLYLRKGSDRITKNSYFEVVDEVINWCWIIAKGINKEQTELRAIQKPTLAAVEISQAEHKSLDNTPLHTQAATIRPATHSPLAIVSSEQLETDEPSKPQGTIDNPEPYTDHNNSTLAQTTAKVETDLVNAIEKLVKLQQQGFLSADEFAQAKAKLLASLQNTE